MMKSGVSSCITCLVIVIGTLSCVKDIVMDAQEKPQLAVVCIMTDNPVQEMTLSLTKGASLKEPVPVMEAEAVLTDLSWGEEAGHFERRGDIWILEYTPIPGHSYKLEVSVPGYDKITAEQEMPEPVQMVARANYYYRIEGLHYPGSLIDPGPFVPNAEDFESLPLGAKSYYIRTLPASLWLFARNYDPMTGRHVTAERICCNYPYTDQFNVTGERYVPPQRTDIPNPYMEGSQMAEQCFHIDLIKTVYFQFRIIHMFTGYIMSVYINKRIKRAKRNTKNKKVRCKEESAGE